MSDKYPRTPHLPWSPGGTSDDRRLPSADHFEGVGVVITEKLDGSNLCVTRNALFARSHSAAPTHPSFSYAKQLHSAIQVSVPPDVSVFGEYCFAVHSIKYDRLPNYIMVFAARDDVTGDWLSWDDVKQCASLMGLPTAPVLFEGIVPAGRLEDITNCLGKQPSSFGVDREGVVVRISDRIEGSFDKSVAKWVRSNHVQTDEHWRNQAIRKQGLA